MIRSHIDLCFLIRVIDVPNSMITPGLREKLKLVRYNKLSEANWSAEALGPDSERLLNIETMFHESYHYWQSLSYSYLVWYSFLGFMELVDGFRRLNRNKPLDRQSIKATGLDRLNRPYYCTRLPDNTAVLSYKETASETDVCLTELDLIESATSIAQWRVYSKDLERSYLSFSRWGKRNPSYTKAFYWSLSLFRNKDLFLTAYPFLVAAAFCSTRPVRTFLSYLSRLAEIEYRLVTDFEPERPFDWPYIFDLFFELEKFDVVPDRMEELSDLDTGLYLPIKLEEAATFKWSGKLPHPISGADVERWAKRVESEASFRLVMGYPDIARSATMECIKDFQPPLTLYRYDLGNRTLVIPSGDVARLGLYGFAAASTMGLLNDFMTMYSVGRRLSGAHFDKDFRLCGHNNCPMFEQNLCNTWMYVPEHYVDCTFLDRLEYVKSVYLR